MPHCPNPCVELSGRVLHLGIAKQVSKLIWLRELVIAVEDHREPGEGEVKIDFVGQYMDLLDEVREDARVTVRFIIRGVAYEWNGEAKHSVKLIGQDIQVQPRPLKKSRKDVVTLSAVPFDEEPSLASGESNFAPNTIRLGRKINEAPVPFPKANPHEEPPF
jgi:hypothetical protein